MEQTERPNYYAVLTAEVRYDKNLSASAKLMYAEITALANKTGSCWAGNQYFADLYGVKVRAVTDWVSQLEKAGYVTVSVNNKAQRKIAIVNGVVKNHQGGSEKSLDNTKTNTVPKGTDLSGKPDLHQKKKDLLALVNRVTGRSFRVLPEKGSKKTLDTFSLVEIEAALGALTRDGWHKPKLKELSIDYFIRSTTIDKFLAKSDGGNGERWGYKNGQKIIIRDEETGKQYWGGELITPQNQDRIGDEIRALQNGS